jgi:hypothetical protein
MIYSALNLPISAGSRVNVELIFDGHADETRLAAASDVLCAWLTGGPLKLPDGVRLASMPMPAADASPASQINTRHR